MFFSIAKLFWFFFAPSALLLWSMLLGAGFLLAGRRRAGTVFTCIAAALLLGLGVMPSYIWMGRSLEYQYDALPKPAHADGILVLSGGAADLARLSTAFQLSRRYPNARIVFSGNVDDTRHAQILLLAWGLAPSRLTLEGRSRDTHDNFQHSMALVRPRPDQSWILVTSAYHLPRAMAVARQQHWLMFPWPADHLTPQYGLTSWRDVPHNLEYFDFLLHEQIGLIAYRWSGRT